MLNPWFPIIIVTVTLGILCYYYLVSSNYNTTKSESVTIRLKESGKVIVYTATTYFGSRIHEGWALKDCPEKREWCNFVNASSYHSNADAVLFHASNFKLDTSYRNPEQIYVWFTQESSANEVINIPSNYINWTMTYRTDSDIWDPYGRLVVAPNSSVDLEKIWEMKTKEAAWVGSNCLTDNRRAEMIYLLQDKGYKAEIFGKCGTSLPSCGRYSSGDCRAKAMRPYKFYLALENSNCIDYVTEKFFNSLAEYEAVPIVIKRDFYKHYGIPDSAYIAIDDFTNVVQLVNYLNYVGSNKTAYLKYHSWRKELQVDFSRSETGFCKLCGRLRDDKGPSKSYIDLAAWYSPLICEQRLLDKYLGRSTVNRFLCNIYSVIFQKYHWNCS